MKRVLDIVIVLAFFVLGYWLKAREVDAELAHTVCVDTITHHNVPPMCVERVSAATERLGTVVVRLPLVRERQVGNTLVVDRIDTVCVEVPISTYTFIDPSDSLRRTQISGFAVTMDKITVCNPSRVQAIAKLQAVPALWRTIHSLRGDIPEGVSAEISAENLL